MNRGYLFFPLISLFLLVNLPAQTDVPTDRNLRQNFPQVAAGPTIVTILDLHNAGPASFNGTLIIVGDDGQALEITINGVPVSGETPLSIPPRGTMRGTLTSAQELKIGHVFIFDQHPLDELDLSSGIYGTATYRITESGQLIDSIGVVGGDLVEAFSFGAEYGPDINTGIAISNPGGDAVHVELRAYAFDGTPKSEASIDVGPFGHEALFVNEIFEGLQSGFRGLVEAEADQAVYPLVLRSEENQLSALQIAPASFLYEGSPQPGSDLRDSFRLSMKNQFLQGWFFSATEGEYMPMAGGIKEGHMSSFIFSAYGYTERTLSDPFWNGLHSETSSPSSIGDGGVDLWMVNGSEREEVIFTRVE